MRDWPACLALGWWIRFVGRSEASSLSSPPGVVLEAEQLQPEAVRGLLPRVEHQGGALHRGPLHRQTTDYQVGELMFDPMLEWTARAPQVEWRDAFGPPTAGNELYLLDDVWGAQHDVIPHQAKVEDGWAMLKGTGP